MNSSAGPPRFEPKQETRFAVVLYGGVSLAIYIHGVVKELLSLVRSTAPDAPFRAAEHSWEAGGEPRRALLGKGELRGAEKVYRKLGQILPLLNGSGPVEPSAEDPIRTRFVIDIVSGTSAGGINGVFLAKALAGNRPMDALKGLWVMEGDIAKLINDADSYVDDVGGLAQQNPPVSLLNSRRMYCKLLSALQNMDQGTPSAETPFVDELDLFVTATDIRGLNLPIRLSDRVIFERRHKSVFHLRYANAYAGRPQNDFRRENNPFMAFAARCTSAFPFAFEPMALGDIDEVLDLELFQGLQPPLNRAAFRDWRQFYPDYLRSAVMLGGGSALDEDTLAEQFLGTAFGDGGYLDNKPFSFAIESLKRRRADLPVDRKLIYVEPSPEHPELDKSKQGKPDALENALAALLSLPRYETIREDLDQVRGFNRLIERVQVLVDGRETDSIHFWRKKGRSAPPTPGTSWRSDDLQEMVRRYGPSYGAYHRLKVSVVTDELALMLARIGGFRESSDEIPATRYLVGAWRGMSYVPYRTSKEESRPTENMFLFEFDFGWRLRRLHFLQSRIDEIYAMDQAQLERRVTAVLELRKTPGFQRILRASRVLKEDDAFQDFRAALLALKCGIGFAYLSLRETTRSLLEDGAERPLAEGVRGLGIKGDHLQAILAEPTDEGRRNMAQNLVEGKIEGLPAMRSSFDRVADEFRGLAAACMTEAAHRCQRLLGLKSMEEVSVSEAVEKLARLLETRYARVAPVARGILVHFYSYFEEYDLISFPVLYETGVGEIDPVEVIRISPEDADNLFNERTGKRRLTLAELQAGQIDPLSAGDRKPKLAGTTLANFGAFLVGQWRINDILWGRLDGAERIVSALLPDPRHRAFRDDLIREAQEEILVEELTAESNRELTRQLAEAFQGAADEAARQDLRAWLQSFVGEVRASQLESLFASCLAKEQLGAFFIESSQRNRDFPPEPTLKSAARATEVVGRMLEALAQKRPELAPAKSWAPMVTWLGRIFWGLVEISVPRSAANLLFRHWLRLIYAFEIFVIAGGMVLGREGVTAFGFTALGITFGIHFLMYILNSSMLGKSGWLRAVRFLGIAVILGLTGLGGVYVAKGHLSADLASWWRDFFGS